MLTIKRRYLRLTLAIGLMALMTLLALTAVAETESKNNDEAAKIVALEKKWSDMFGQDDLEGIMALHAKNAVQLPPGADIVKGSEALRQAWKGMIETEGLEISWESTAAFVAKSGDMAYDYGQVKLTNPDGSKANAKYLVVWTKINGEWKVAADAYNMSGPAK